MKTTTNRVGAREITSLSIMTLIALVGWAMIIILFARLIPSKSTIEGRAIIEQRGKTDDFTLNISQEKALSLIPDQVLDAFEADGLTISYDNKGIYWFFAPKWSSGVTVLGKFDGKVKGIHVRSEYAYSNKAEVTMHEMGHYVDRKLGCPSESLEWERICKSEAANSMSYNLSDPRTEGATSYYDDPVEFFAEEFMYYCMQYDEEGSYARLLWKAECSNCPMAQEYIAKLVEESFEQ